jgi:hypothetical protein
VPLAAVSPVGEAGYGDMMVNADQGVVQQDRAKADLRVLLHHGFEIFVGNEQIAGGTH